jgi:DNA (cytosine-5)-methyltransferase 1
LKRDLMSLPLDLGNELIIDNFAGGGGTSTGLEWAFGRPVDIAINHDPEALAMHALNHPHTKHLCESVWDVDPIKVTGNQPVGLVWLSPDCKHFSKAKGGTPVSKNIRGLAWITLRWLLQTSPRAFMIENVEEFVTWGELIEIEPGKWIPDPSKKGETFRAFIGMITTGVSPDHPALIEACEMLGIELDSRDAKRLINGLGYTADWKELRACDNGAPTIRKRLFIVGRRDGLPIVFPEATHGTPTSVDVLAGLLQPFRTAAECIDFDLPAQSIFDRKKPLVFNSLRRVAKGAWRHVLSSASPFIVGVGGRMGQSPERSVHAPVQTITSKADSCVAQPVLTPFLAGAGGPAYSGKPVSVDQPFGTLTTENHRAVVTPELAPFITEHANASNQRTMPADEPMRTICAQVKGGHFSVVAPTLVPLRGTSEAHLGGHSVEQPLSTISAGGTHHAMVSTHIMKFRTESAGSPMDEPMPTVTASSFIKRPGGSAPLGIVAAHLAHLTHHGERPGSTPDEPLPTVTGANRGEQALIAANLIDMGHGESCSTGAKRWSHGTRSLEAPLNTVTASGTPSAMTAAYFEQANGGFYEGTGRAANQPMSTITAAGSNQQLVTAYLVKYYGSGGQDQNIAVPMHTLPTKGRMGLVESVQVPVDSLAPEHREKARKCAALLHEHLPEQFPDAVDMVMMIHSGTWWVMVDITLRMLKARELYRAQSFPSSYIIHEIPDPKLLFKDGVQVPGDPRLLPRIPLTITAQIRMCGNSVAPAQAEALIRTNFAHERKIVRAA